MKMYNKLLVLLFSISILPISGVVFADDEHEQQYCRDGKLRNPICQGLKTVLPGQSKQKQAKLYAICQNYCVEKKCDLNDTRGHKKHCIKLLDKWTDLANGAVIPCNASPGITLNKEVVLSATSVEIGDTDNVPQGTKIKYKFTIQNNGNVPLENINLTDDNLDTLYGISNLVNCVLPSVLLPNGTVICETQELKSLYRPEDSLIINNAKVTATPSAPYAQVSVVAEDAANYQSVAAASKCPCATDWAEFFGDTVNLFEPTQCGPGFKIEGYKWEPNSWAAVVDPSGVGYTCQLRNEGTFIVDKGGSGPGGKLSADEKTACLEEALKYCTSIAPTP